MALTAAEQYGIELLNRARMDPNKEAALQKMGLNANLPAGTISSTPKQVLAPSTQLQAAADKHSSYMLRVDKFAHDGIGNGTPGSRFRAEGYAWSAYAENINYASVGYSSSLERLTAIQHGMLFDSSGHRKNLMTPWVNEVGFGLAQGSFGGNNVSMLTETFGFRSRFFVTGVTYTDKVSNNDFYNIGEARGGLTFTLESGKSVSSATAGGYALQVTPSDETRVSINGGRLAVVDIDTSAGKSGYNAKLDVVFEKDGSAKLLVSTSTTLVSGSITDIKALGIAHIALTGGAADNILWGNVGNNRLSGEAGNDRIYGGFGNDTLNGGEGNDVLNGDDGNDRFNAGTGDDLANGGNGNDFIHGQDGDDVLNGGAGNDTLHADTGNDTLNGGSGSDVFVFTESNTDQIDKDVVQDFGAGDILQINAALLDNGQTIQDILANATVVDGNLELTFEFGDKIVLVGVTDANSMANQIQIIGG